MPSHDASNDSLAHQRNRLRHHVLPALRQENPDAERALGRAAAALRELAQALDWAADRALVELDVRASAKRVELDATRLAALPSGVAKRVLQRLAEGLGVSLEAQHLDAALALARSARGRAKSLALPRITARRDRDHFVLESGALHMRRKRARRLDESGTRGYQ